jgi:hypothetical protein
MLHRSAARKSFIPEFAPLVTMAAPVTRGEGKLSTPAQGNMCTAAATPP